MNIFLLHWRQCTYIHHHSICFLLHLFHSKFLHFIVLLRFFHSQFFHFIFLFQFCISNFIFIFSMSSFLSSRWIRVISYSLSTRCHFLIQVIFISFIFLLSSIMTFSTSSIWEVVPSLHFCFFNLSFLAFTPSGLSKFTIRTYRITSTSKCSNSRLESEDASNLLLFGCWLLTIINHFDECFNKFQQCLYWNLEPWITW